MSGTVGNNVGRGSGSIVLPAGGLASGTKTDFFQASAPTDWTQDATNNDKMLRVVSGTGGGTGGTSATSSPAHTIAAAAHTLVTSEMPAHTHTIPQHTSAGSGYSAAFEQSGSPHAGPPMTVTSASTGGGGSHTHSTSGSITTPLYMDVIIATKD